jgi:hypothetical protein
MTNEFEQVWQIISDYRVRAQAFLAAGDEAKVEPTSDVVIPTFDSDGYLTDLYIEPTAMTQFTNTEFEQILTGALQDGVDGWRDTGMAVFHRFWSPESPLYQQDV